MRLHLAAIKVISIMSVLLIANSAIEAQMSSAPPLLTEQEAVELAQSANRQIKKSALDIDSASQSVWEAKSNYYPQTNILMTSGYPLGSIDFTIPAGALGTYAATGPIPGRNVEISGGQNFTVTTYGTVAQPLSQIYKIHLSVELARNAVQLAKETTLQQRESVTDQARQDYHQICVLDAQLDADRSQVKALEEALKTVQDEVAQGTALEASRLQGKSALVQERYTLEKDEDALVSAKEQLNTLLARDIDTAFSVEPLPALSDDEMNLAQARATALRQRPEIHEAKLQIEKANLDVRQERSGYIPDVSAQLTYIGFQNSDFLPKNIATLGIGLQWKNPWDWGNRKAKINADRDVAKQQTLTADDTTQQVTLDVDQKFRALKEARLLVDSAAAARDASGESLREITSQLKQHAALLSDVLKQAADDQKQSENYTQALAAYWNARADFDLALGRD